MSIGPVARNTGYNSMSGQTGEREKWSDTAGAIACLVLSLHKESYDD